MTISLEAFSKEAHNYGLAKQMTFHMALPKARYALQWESKNLYALSSAIQDWVKSSNWFGFQAADTFV